MDASLAAFKEIAPYLMHPLVFLSSYLQRGNSTFVATL
jgi:hypothetical protein